MADETPTDLEFTERLDSEGFVRTRGIQVPCRTWIAWEFTRVPFLWERGRPQRGRSSAIEVGEGLVRLTLENGTWLYRLGEYDPNRRAYAATLIKGDPIP
jgi:hypothetical protein